MSMPGDVYHLRVMGQMGENWRTFMDNLDQSLKLMEENLDEVAGMTEACTSEWCEATEHVLDDLSNSIFSISEPRWTTKDDSDKIKRMKARMHDLYAKYKSIQS